MHEQFVYYNRKVLDSYVAIRDGEIKAGEKIRVLSEGEDIHNLAAYSKQGVRYVLIGVPESVGPLANHGDSGAQNAWEPFLVSFLNMQHNEYLNSASILCLGHVNIRSIQAETGRLQKSHSGFYVELRKMCEEIDRRVEEVATKVFQCGLIPIVIGGGHNNAYPLLKAAAQTIGKNKGVNCLNCDPHADFRPMEGRHSGNSFSYARHEGWLNRYAVTGLHRNYNSQAMLNDMKEDKEVYFTFREDETGITEAIKKAVAFLKGDQRPAGLELDIDSLAFIPVSAFTPSGMSVEEARQYIRVATRLLSPAYLHLPEGAPAASAREDKMVGKTLALLVADFVWENEK